MSSRSKVSTGSFSYRAQLLSHVQCKTRRGEMEAFSQGLKEIFQSAIGATTLQQLREPILALERYYFGIKSYFALLFDKPLHARDVDPVENALDELHAAFKRGEVSNCKTRFAVAEGQLTELWVGIASKLDPAVGRAAIAFRV